MAEIGLIPIVRRTATDLIRFGEAILTSFLKGMSEHIYILCYRDYRELTFPYFLLRTSTQGLSRDCIPSFPTKNQEASKHCFGRCSACPRGAYLEMDPESPKTAQAICKPEP